MLAAASAPSSAGPHYVNSTSTQRLGASFRDPSGFVFSRRAVVYRQVNASYRAQYERFIDSGLYAELTTAGMLLSHEGSDEPLADVSVGWKVLRPEQLEFISQPYEWCFSQLRDAALLTLDIQTRALQRGMTLKDASAYNVQFHHGRPVLIDTLSFEEWVDGTPWTGYRQFCRHFLAPLALMARRDVRLGQLSRVHLDGIPLDLASSLLPRRSWFRLGLAAHLHLHARSESSFAPTDTEVSASARRLARVSLRGLLALIAGLRRTIAGLRWDAQGTEWADYYAATSYSDAAMGAKRDLVASCLASVQPRTVWDLGANTGQFSRLAVDAGAFTVAFDIDPAAVERHYLTTRRASGTGPLPLVLDLANPSPAIGWAHEERQSLLQRGPADCVMALALIHHLCIGNNVPFEFLARFLAGVGRHLIIEFVPKSDAQVVRLLRGRADIFHHYDRASFETAFAGFFEIVRSEAVAGTERVIYLMRRRTGTGANTDAATQET